MQARSGKLTEKTQDNVVEMPSRRREFERLYRESYSLVYNFVCYRMAGDHAAEDVVADAFLQAARNFRSFDPTRSKFSTWVISIAKNCMVSHYRKAKPTVALDDAPQKSLSVEGDQAHVDDRILVTQLLAALEPDVRELVFMKYYEGKRNVEIAEELGMNASTVSTKLADAMHKMRAVANGLPGQST